MGISGDKSSGLVKLDKFNSSEYKTHLEKKRKANAINFCMGFGGCVECKSNFNIQNTHDNGMQDSFDGEYC